MLRADLNQSWKQQPTKQQAVWPLTSHLTNHKDKQVMWRTAGEVRTDSQTILSDRVQHKVIPVETDQ